MSQAALYWPGSVELHFQPVHSLSMVAYAAGRPQLPWAAFSEYRPQYVAGYPTASLRHRGPGRVRHGEGGAVVGHARSGPSRSPPVGDESIADAVAGHVGAEVLRRRRPRAPLRRRAKARRAGRQANRPRSSPCCRPFRCAVPPGLGRRFRRSCRPLRRSWPPVPPALVPPVPPGAARLDPQAPTRSAPRTEGTARTCVRLSESRRHPDLLTMVNHPNLTHRAQRASIYDRLTRVVIGPRRATGRSGAIGLEITDGRGRLRQDDRLADHRPRTALNAPAPSGGSRSRGTARRRC